MKNKLFLTQELLGDMIKKFQILASNPETVLINFDKDEIIFEEDLAKLFGTTQRTLRRLRNEKILTFFKMFGRIIYLRTFLYLDLLTAYYNENMR